VQEQAKRYSKAKIVWAQEEPMNQGAWGFVNPHFVTAFKGITTGTGFVVSLITEFRSS
jgi:2-oxoglutarate dehydrogenase E1 component